MQMHVYKLFTLSTPQTKCPMSRQQSQKLRFVGAAMFFFTNASFHIVQNYMACGYQQSLSCCIICQDVCVQQQGCKSSQSVKSKP